MAQSTNAPFRDAVTLYGTGTSIPQSTSAPFLDVGVQFAPTITQAATSGVQLLVNGTPVDGTFARSFEEQIADTGSFSYQMLREDFAGDFDDLITYKIDGTARFLGVVEALDHNALTSGESAEQTVTVSGRGSLALLEQAVVYPSRGVDALPIEEVRSFSWPTPDFDSSSWPYAKQVNPQRSYAFFDGGFVGSAGPVPHIWPDTTGYWIWANRPDVSGYDAPPGTCLFRKTFTLAADATVRFFVAFDNNGILFVDGANVAQFVGFLDGQFVEMELSAGDHTIAASVKNYSAGSYNPGGFICAVYTVAGTGLLDDLVTHTDATWKCLPYPATMPGFTHGQVLRILFEEAGLDSTWTLDFTDTKDSAGQPWSTYREITVEVGRYLLDVIREMADSFLDVAAAPGSLMLRAWNRGTRGVTTSVSLQQTTDPATSDFLSLSHAGKRTRMNKALVRYADGYFEREDTVSTGLYGDRGGYLELGAIQGLPEAAKITDEVMENRARPAFSTAATLHPHNTAATPYKGFGVADWIGCYDETDSVVSQRVRSIAMAEDDDGVIDWPITLRDEQLEIEERHDIQLRRMSPGTLGGARVASRAGKPDPTATQITALKVAEFSYDNTALTVSTSPKRPAETSGNIVEVYGQLTTAGSSTTTVLAKLNGSTIATLTFASGETEADVAVSILPVKANTDKTQVEITAAGTGAEGLVVQFRAI